MSGERVEAGEYLVPSTLEFRILGPLEVVGAGPVFVRARKQRTLLASLLLRANQVVPTARLIENLWDHHGPDDGRGALQVHVARLRKTLDSSRGGGLIRTLPEGYLIDVPTECLDLSRFQELIGRVARTRDQLAPAQEARLLTEALALWRGEVLTDILSDSLRSSEIPQLEEQWLATTERRFELELHLGRHQEIIGELRAATRDHPLRETLWAQLMTALHRGGRQAEALEVYRSVRRTLVEELGLEPGARLTRLNQAILRDPAEPVPGFPADRPDTDARPAVRADTSWQVQDQLPPDVPHFTGRAALLAELTGAIRSACATGVPILALSGAPGTGKSALAVRLARTLAGDFPDGQWYARINGPRAAAREPADVLAELLRASGMDPNNLPEATEARAAMFRARLAGRRVLLLLDDVRDTSQVSALLPGSPGSAVLVTARGDLTSLVALHGATPVTVGVLTPDESVTLLDGVLGAGRVDAEREAVLELAGLCGHLPLALRIAAANLAGRPREPMRDYLAELHDTNRLGKLATGATDTAEVRATFDLSYRMLSPDAQRLFRTLGSVPTADVTTEVVEVLAPVIEVNDGAAVLDELVRAHMIETRQPGRFAFHELLRLHATDLAQVSDTDRVSAVGSVLEWYLCSTRSAVQAHRPGLVHLPRTEPDQPGTGRVFNDDLAALHWLDRERANLAALVEYAAEHGPRHASWQLADLLRGYFWSGRHYDEWLSCARAGARAAGAEKDDEACNAMRFSLGLAYRCLGDYAASERHLRSAVAGAREAGQSGYETAALGESGVLAAVTGEQTAALTVLRRAHGKARRLGLRHTEARTLRNLAGVHHALGHLETARDHLLRALEIDRKAGLRHGEPEGLRMLGLVLHDLGEPERALERLSFALATGSRGGDRFVQVACHCGLSLVHQRIGPHPLAMAHARQARELGAASGDPLTEVSTLHTLAEAYRTLGQLTEAAGLFHRALTRCRTLTAWQPETEILLGLARTQRARHEPELAVDAAQRALGRARHYGLRLLEGTGEAVLGSVHLDRGDPARARTHLHRALAIQEETGHAAELPGTRALLARAEDALPPVSVPAHPG